MEKSKKREEVKVKVELRKSQGNKNKFYCIYSHKQEIFRIYFHKKSVMRFHDFTEMPVWQQGLDVVEKVYGLTTVLPRSEEYALSSQLKRASLSVPANIAEGFGRLHTKDKINFYIYSRSSAFEVRSHLLAGQKLKFFSEIEINPVNQLCLQIIEANNRIIKGFGNSH